MIILDEPTANLAVKEIDKVLDIILSLKENGIPAVFISHRLDDIFKVCDRICILRRGKIVKICETKSTNRDEIIRHMFLKIKEKDFDKNPSEMMKDDRYKD